MQTFIIIIKLFNILARQSKTGKMKSEDQRETKPVVDDSDLEDNSNSFESKE